MNKILIISVVILILAIGFFYFNNRSENDENQRLTEEPYIVGDIHSVFDNRILIAEDSKGENYTGNIEDLEGNAVWITIDEKTKIMDDDNNVFETDNLQVGLKAKVWLRGVILESYPAQGTGDKIVVLTKEIEEIEEEIEEIEEKEETAKECFIGGCSGELCTDDPETMSTCEILPGMECLKEGTSCELVNNECTWILSQSAAECFLNVKLQEGEEVLESRIGYLFEKAERKNE